MGRYRNSVSGVVVNVDDDTAATLAAEWKPVGEQEPTGYAAMKLPELRAEIEKRNKDRADEDKISAAGNKPDLVAALDADDAKSES